jgi:hypothetical protein
MSIVRVGSTQKFSENWENIFGGKKSVSAGKKSGEKKKKTPVKGAKRRKK